MADFSDMLELATLGERLAVSKAQISADLASAKSTEMIAILKMAASLSTLAGTVVNMDQLRMAAKFLNTDLPEVLEDMAADKEAQAKIDPD